MSKLKRQTDYSDPRVYVGTYEKYNNGSIKGEWVDLNDHDKDSFYEECKRIHSDESDPEFMFQDYEGFPDYLYNESGLSDKIWDWLKLSEDDREILALASYAIDSDGIEDARNAFCGVFDSRSQWAEDFLDNTGGLSGLEGNLKYYFDFERYARDCEGGGDIVFVEHKGQLWAFNPYA